MSKAVLCAICLLLAACGGGGDSYTAAPAQAPAKCETVSLPKLGGGETACMP